MKILLISFFVLGILYADNCDDTKIKSAKYEKMGIATKNLDIAAKYLEIAIKNKKEAMNSCFYSAFEKEKMYKDIDELKDLVKNMKNESRKIKEHELDIAEKRATIHIDY